MTLGESLADKVKKMLEQPSVGTPHVKTNKKYPTGWEPGVRYDKDTMSVITDAVPKLENEDSWKAAVEALGVSMPDGWKVTLVEAKYDGSAWQRQNEGEDATTAPVWRYKFRVDQTANSINADELFSVIDKHRARKKSAEEKPVNLTSTWILATGDWQLGKSDGDGAVGTVERILEATDKAVDRIRELKRLKRFPGTAALFLTGDCVEGFVSQGGGNVWRTNMTMTEQVRAYRRLVMHMTTTLANEVDNLQILAVPGNHGETFRIGKNLGTRVDDSWDLDAVVAVEEALRHKGDSYDHVRFTLPDVDESTVTVDLGGTIVGCAHGHLIQRGDVKKWIGEQARNMAPIGDAHLIITGHRHHLRVESMGPRTWIQVPAMESESTWWRNRTGEVSPPGMVSLLTGEKTWGDLAVH